MAMILTILRAILRALGLLKPASSESDASHAVEIPPQQSVQAETPRYPYCRRDDFLSTAELNFFRILYQAVGENALLCVKVNLGDLFYVPSRDPSEHRVYTNKIDRKHVDFVLCDPQTLTARLGIELDDRSHARTDRQQRDHFVENVFAAAGLPLLRIKVQHSYSVQELAEIIHSYWKVGSRESAMEAVGNQPVRMVASATMPQVAMVGETSTPICPKCANEMVLRTVRSGANAGQRFWGCSNYPRCKAMVAYTAVVADA